MINSRPPLHPKFSPLEEIQDAIAAQKARSPDERKVNRTAYVSHDALYYANQKFKELEDLKDAIRGMSCGVMAPEDDGDVIMRTQLLDEVTRKYVTNLESEVEVYKRDAKRYRFLRSTVVGHELYAGFDEMVDKQMEVPHG